MPQNYQRKAYNSPSLPKPVVPYCHVAEVSGASKLAFIAGQVPVDQAGKVVGEGDVKAQARQVFQNIETILKELGATPSNIVEFTTFVVGRESIAPLAEARREIFARLFPAGDYPPNTLVLAAGLASEAIKVEIKTVVALP